MAGVEERQAFAKLEALKDIRSKTISLEKTRVSLLVDVGQLEDEERCLVRLDIFYTISTYYCLSVCPYVLRNSLPLYTSILHVFSFSLSFSLFIPIHKLAYTQTDTYTHTHTQTQANTYIHRYNRPL